MAGPNSSNANPVGLILMYHRIAYPQSDPWRLAVSPPHFAEHLEVLRGVGVVLPLAEAVKAIQCRELRAGTIVVTFDDGYADNFYKALPLLERYDMPATVFLTTGYIGSTREFWWDALERIMLEPDLLPAELRLAVSGRTSEWLLGEAHHYTGEERRSDREWFAARHGTPSKRYELYRAVHRLLQPLAEGERRATLDSLSGWARVDNSARDSHRCLSRDEVAALGRRELIELGAHTVTHPLLPGLPQTLQSAEVRESKVELEQLLGHPVKSFAYPYGLYAADTVTLVRHEGFSSACSIAAGVLNRETDLFSLPRIKVQDWDGDTLARILHCRFTPIAMVSRHEDRATDGAAAPGDAVL